MRTKNESIEFREKLRQDKQRLMFSVYKQDRQRMYDSIYQNLTIINPKDHISPLRRLEIRYLPLDPKLVRAIFEAMKVNFIMQELVLTDECLQYCDKEVFAELNDSLVHNRQSALTLLDFSRNYHAFSDNTEIHEALIKAMKTQKSKPEGLKI